jgi:hypothetical protein
VADELAGHGEQEVLDAVGGVGRIGADVEAWRERAAGQVPGVFAAGADLVHHRLFADPQPRGEAFFGQHVGQGGAPASSADDRDLHARPPSDAREGPHAREGPGTPPRPRRDVGARF